MRHACKKRNKMRKKKHYQGLEEIAGRDPLIESTSPLTPRPRPFWPLSSRRSLSAGLPQGTQLVAATAEPAEPAPPIPAQWPPPLRHKTTAPLFAQEQPHVAFPASRTTDIGPFAWPRKDFLPPVAGRSHQTRRSHLAVAAVFEPEDMSPHTDSRSSSHCLHKSAED